MDEGKPRIKLANGILKKFSFLLCFCYLDLDGVKDSNSLSQFGNLLY